MRHLGDITKINGANAPVVDVIIGGSPCTGWPDYGVEKRQEESE